MYSFKKAFIFTVLLLNIGFCFGQVEDTKDTKHFDRKKFFTGGNFGLQFGTLTLINLSPLFGYNINDKLKAGIGGTYIYLNDKSSFGGYTANTFGGRVFFRYLFFQNFFAHTEYEVLNGNWFVGEPRRNVTSLFIGGGLAQQIGKNGTANILLLYNLNQGIFSPYTSNPIIRVGYNINIF